MENTERQKLMHEYVRRFSNLRYWLIHYLMAYGRFSIKNNAIVEKTLNSVIYGACLIGIHDLMLVYIIYETSIVVNYLLYTELFILLQTSVLINLFVLNITFSKGSGTAKLINYCIDTDILLGREDTKFMRDLEDSVYIVIGIPVLLAQITIVTFMYFTFEVSTAVHIIGTTYFVWMLSEFYDLNYLVTQSCFISLRIRYLNVALMNFLNVDLKIVPDLIIFRALFWKAKYNELVTFHKKAGIKQFIDAYKRMIYTTKMFQECLKFLIFTGIICVAGGSLLSVQAVIIYGRTGIDMLRKTIIVSWVTLCFSFLLTMCLLIDVISRQIDQTKLICTFAQLRSPSDDTVYWNTKAILRALEIRDARISIYDLFYFDPSTMLRMSGSLFVYITAQLQLTLPAVEEANTVYNGSTAAATIHI